MLHQSLPPSQPLPLPQTDDLEKLLESNPALKPKFVYTIPAFHNPTGYSLSHERKQHLVRMAAKYDFMVLADEVYQLLGFDGVPRPADALCYYDTVETAGAGAGGCMLPCYVDVLR